MSNKPPMNGDLAFFLGLGFIVFVCFIGPSMARLISAYAASIAP